MEGNVLSIKTNEYGNKTYGFISDNNGDSYFFYKSDLVNCRINQLEEGDVVEFEPSKNDDRNVAKKVRKIYQAAPELTMPTPGMHPAVKLDHFNPSEEKIVRLLSKSFYVTSGGDRFEIGRSTYKYCFVKPTDYFIRNFQLQREIVVVFSDYVSFEPRSLEAAPMVYEKTESNLRLDRGCQILICHDDAIEEKLVNLLKDSNVNQIVIPFTYRELLSDCPHAEIIQERFRKYLFDTDLFSVSAPITNNIFFFGRRDFVHDIVSKCKIGYPSGVFGLRRSGKTSLLYAVQNLLKQQGYPTVFIPCESDLRTLDWRTALCKVVRNIYDALKMDTSDIQENNYRTGDTTICFEKDMYLCLKDIHVPVTIMFDEIEAITFGVLQGEDSDNSWLDGVNFVHFWDTIKGYCSKHPSHISILIAGTNPMINEVAFIGKTPNPMFRQISESNQGPYLQAFTVDDTKNMVNTLGGYMGLSFDDYSVGELKKDCGGHPYLMRILCSHINKYVRSMKMERPAIISKAIYDKAIIEFEKSSEAISFFWMILNILMTGYPKEFNTLKMLALEGDSVISQIQEKNDLLHLIGYGLVEYNQGTYEIKYEIITRFLRGEYRFERQGLNIEEQKQEIQLRINNAEMKLRRLVKNTLRMALKETEAKSKVLDAMRKNRAIGKDDVQKANNLTYAQLFDASTNKIYFSLLEGIILENLSIFSNVFEPFDEKTIRENLATINSARRCPGHSYTANAENWSWNDFERFREGMTWLETILADFE